MGLFHINLSPHVFMRQNAGTPNLAVIPTGEARLFVWSEQPNRFVPLGDDRSYLGPVIEHVIPRTQIAFELLKLTGRLVEA